MRIIAGDFKGRRVEPVPGDGTRPTTDRVREAVAGVFSRMDPALVLADRRIKPGEKRLFAEVLGLPDPKVSELSYVPELFRQGIHRIRTCGLSYTLASVRQYLLHKSARVGR